MAQRSRISRPTVAEYVRRAPAAGLSWPLPDSLAETPFERRLCAPTHHTPAPRGPPSAWPQGHRALRRQGVPLGLRGQADKTATPAGGPYRQCCAAYRPWAGPLDLGMRQHHRAGEQRFVASAGQTLPVGTRRTGEVHEVAIVIAVLGASNAPYVEATWSQRLPAWIGAHVRTFEALGGVPEGRVPDHLKAAVRQGHRYEPVRHRTYADLAQHSSIAVLPARAAHPRDKAKGEVGVPVVQRWMLARLRPHTFCSLPAVHTAIAPFRVARHPRPCTQLPGARHSLFAALDRPRAPAVARPAVCVCRVATGAGAHR
jgi:transposase